jgi:hypothetical protein
VLVASSDDEARWWFRSVQQRYLDRLRTGGAPLRGPDDVELDWSAGERYRVDGMLEAAVVGSAGTVRRQLRAMGERLAPDEVMAMTDLPDPETTVRSHTRLGRGRGGRHRGRCDGMTVPRELVAMLRVPRWSARGSRRSRSSPSTPDGFPHPALLSRAELEVGPAGELHAALRSRRTRANLERSGLAALIAVEGRTAHYVKLRVARSLAVHDLLACVFEIVEHKRDSLGIPLAPVTYEVTAEITRAERWDLTPRGSATALVTSPTSRPRNCPTDRGRRVGDHRPSAAGVLLLGVVEPNEAPERPDDVRREDDVHACAFVGPEDAPLDVQRHRSCDPGRAVG